MPPPLAVSTTLPSGLPRPAKIFSTRTRKNSALVFLRSFYGKVCGGGVRLGIAPTKFVPVRLLQTGGARFFGFSRSDRSSRGEVHPLLFSTGYFRARSEEHTSE